MKNPLECRHQLFRVHRVYGIRHDRLDFTFNKFETIWKTVHCIKRYSQICKMRKHEKTQRIGNIFGYEA